MKLFQSLLIAPAALGLLSPIVANASEINLDDISNYSKGEIELNSNSFNKVAEQTPLLISGGEGLVTGGGYDSDSFSSTTSASFSVDMAIGAESDPAVVAGDGNILRERLEARYGFQIDLATSFTGEDSLDISIDAGNGGGALAEFDMNSGGDGLTVDGVSYTFPVGAATVFVGDNMDGSTLYNTACVYGGPSNTLDDCGNVNAAFVGSGTAAGASYDFDNGFSAAVGYAGDGGTNGLGTLQGDDAYGAQVTYTGDTYGASITYALAEATGVETASWAFNAYYSPLETGVVPSISVGYEVDNPENTAIDSTSYFLGLSWDEVGPGSFGAALGTSTPTSDVADELLMYEAYYVYPVNDGMTITPLIYTVDSGNANNDETGVMVKTSFSF